MRNPVMPAFVLKALVLLPLLAAQPGCSVKAESKPDSNSHGADALPPQAVELDKEFFFDDSLRADNGVYTLTRDFTFTLTEETNVLLWDHGTVSSCDLGAHVDGPHYLLTNADKTVKLASRDVDGFTKVDELLFPGKLPAGTYMLSAQFASPTSCFVSSTLELEKKAAPQPDPVPSPDPNPNPNPQPDPNPNPNPNPQPDPNPNPSPNPNPQPDPNPAPNPVPQPANELQGFWLQEIVGFVRDEMRVAADGKITQKVWVQGELYLDVEATGTLDAAAAPKRARMTVTKVNYANPDAGVTVGTENLCIYALSTDGAALKMECDAAYPAAFDDDASTYAKQP